jgi:MFS family permease
MQWVAIDWHIYVLTGSPLALGLVGLCRVIPIVVFSLWGGVVADRSDRRRVMLATQGFMLLVAIVLGFATRSGIDTVPLLYLLTAASAAASAFDNPARQALIPRLVPRAELPGALALNLTMFHGAMIVGPALAGLLLAAVAGGTPGGAAAGGETGGIAWIYFANAVTFLGTLGALLTLRTSTAPEGDPASRERPVAALQAGLRFVFGSPILVWTMVLDFVATFFSAALSLLPIFADQILGVGASGFGWLRSAPAIGAVAGAFFTAAFPLPRKQGKIFLWAVGVYGLATVVFGLSRSFPLTFAALAIGGLADLISTVVRQTVRQLITPDGLRGRMTSVNMLFFMGGPQLGELEAGLVASLFATAALGATVSVVSGGLLTILVTAWVAARAPVVRRFDVHDVL